MGSARSGAAARSSAYVPALDGIRAMAVAGVLLFHGGAPFLPGGFLGVDVFFVLSGYLITALLLEEHRRTGGIALRRFWARRARRLLPCLLAVLVAVAVFAVFFEPTDTLGQLRQQALGSLFYVGNWVQLQNGINYFAALATPSPLVHTWSLGIEEQFYVLWPLLVLGVLFLARRRWLLRTLCIVGALASAVEMAVLYHHGGSADVNRVYYGTDTRAQDLLVGAALATFLPLSGRRVGRHTPRRELRRAGRTATRAGMAGIAVLLVAMLTAGESSGWLFRGGFFVVDLATVGVLAAAVLAPKRSLGRLLSWAPMRGLGRISYGLYLWHWPIFLLLDASRTGLSGIPLFVLRVAASVGVAIISYVVIEMPVRVAQISAWVSRTMAPAAYGATAVALLAATAAATPTMAAVYSASGSASSVSSSSTGPASPGTGANVPSVPAGTGGPVRVLLLGDSEPVFMAFGLNPGSDAYGVDIAVDGVIGCGMVQGKTRLKGQVEATNVGFRGANNPVYCGTQLQRWQADVEAFHPDVVVVQDGEIDVRDHLEHGKWIHLGERGFNADLQQAFEQAVPVLHQTGAAVVLLTAPYYNQGDNTAGEPWPEDEVNRVWTYNHIVRMVASANPGVVQTANLNAIVDPGGHFAATLGGQPSRYSDGVHMTPAAGRYVQPRLLPQLQKIGTENRAAAAAAPAAPPPSAPGTG